MALKQTIEGLLADATRTGKPARVRLVRGLTVSVRVEGDLVDVQLSRGDVYPATTEWKTVLRAWPRPWTLVKHPKPLKDTTTYYLSGTLRLVPRLVEA